MTARRRIALVDDHSVVLLSLSLLIARTADLVCIDSASNVGGLSTLGVVADLVVLDLRLADGSSVAENVSKLRSRGSQVLVFTSSDNPFLLRSAARTGILGIVSKSAPQTEILSAISRAARGDVIATTEWAATVDADAEFGSANLGTRERQVLALYASGASSQSVAHQLGITTHTVDSHVKNIRLRYQALGRASPTKIDLYRRAVEDGYIPSPENIR